MSGGNPRKCELNLHIILLLLVFIWSGLPYRFTLHLLFGHTVYRLS